MGLVVPTTGGGGAERGGLTLTTPPGGGEGMRLARFPEPHPIVPGKSKHNDSKTTLLMMQADQGSGIVCKLSPFSLRMSTRALFLSN